VSDPKFSKRDLLVQGLHRVREVGAVVTELAVEGFADRFAPRVCRPPGAVSEIEFLVACTRCGECVKACPAGAILNLDEQAGLASGTPFLDPNRYRPCVVCTDAPCMPACPTGALQVMDMRDTFMGVARLNRDTCRAWNDMPCTNCLKACPYPEDAILFDDDDRPWIDPRHCIGCGRCIPSCPTRPKSIVIDPPPRF
jgi:MauM/NapG family ferredoxin protein